MEIANSLRDFSSFLEQIIKISEFRIDQIRISEQSQWSVTNGALSHCSKGFFQVAGARNRKTREEHLVLYQPEGALTGLAVCKYGAQIFILLQARVEPGNSGIGQYGPTIQSTPANYRQAHGGKKACHLELFTEFGLNANPLGDMTQVDIGKRYFHKSKIHSYVELAELTETEENMIWVPLDVIIEAVNMDNFLNADFRSLLSVFDWDQYLQEDHVPSGNQDTTSGNQTFLLENHLGINTWELIPLEQLTKWKIEEHGIIDQAGTGIWVEMFKISSTNREVNSWSQPLMCCSGRGLAILFVRQVKGQYEFLVTFEPEFGITGEINILPSYLQYPGEESSIGVTDHGEGTVLASIIQSDEGGRFYKNESIYKVILVDPELVINSNQSWVSVKVLKSILKTSNRAGFQLRCISSLILGLLNPIACSRSWKRDEIL